MTGFNLARYTIDIYGPESEPAEEGSAYRWAEADAKLLDLLPDLIAGLESNLTFLLPEGYTARIRPSDE